MSTNVIVRYKLFKLILCSLDGAYMHYILYLLLLIHLEIISFLDASATYVSDTYCIILTYVNVE